MYSNVAKNDRFLVKSKNREGIYPVTNVTPKRFEVGGFTFNKETGYQVGGEAYSTVTIEKATEELEVEFKLRVQRVKLVKEFSKVDFNEFTLEQLQQAKSLFDSFNK